MIKEKERQLFERWKKDSNYSFFLTDGLFNEEEWNKQAVKILFVLKEANFKSHETTSTNNATSLDIRNFNNDLCTYLLSEKSPTYWKTWNNIVRWTQAIREGGNYQMSITKEDKTKCLKTIAALNIKKEAGGAYANTEEIRQYGEADASFIIQQIELYTPDVIVCCGKGTDVLYKTVLANMVEECTTPGKHKYFIYTLKSKEDNSISYKSIPIIPFRHPQMRGGHIAFKKSYNDMLSIATYLKSDNCF